MKRSEKHLFEKGEKKLYKKCNHRYAYDHYGQSKYVPPMSWQGTVLCVLALLLSRSIWYIIFDLNGGLGLFTSVIALFYFADSLYIDYIFCKYTYFGKTKNIDEQARAGDWLSCFYVADSVFVLIGSIFAVFLFIISWRLIPTKICTLVLFFAAVFLVLPVFQTTSRKMTLLWCILRVVLYGTVQRAGYLTAFFMGIYAR